MPGLALVVAAVYAPPSIETWALVVAPELVVKVKVVVADKVTPAAGVIIVRTGVEGPGVKVTATSVGISEPLEAFTRATPAEILDKEVVATPEVRVNTVEAKLPPSPLMDRTG